MSDNDFAIEDDQCITNPVHCKNGFSFSLFYFPEYAETDSELAAPDADFDKEYLFSSGGDHGHPGVAVYRQGGTFGVLVSTGAHNWVVEVVGGIPQRNKWSNIAVRWRPLNFNNNSTEFEMRVKEGERDEDFGGLTVFMDLKKLGFALLPEELDCADGKTCPETEVKKPLEPPEVLLGCHKTSSNASKRHFASGSFDELALWKRWINDTELPFFLGGYSYVFSTNTKRNYVFRQ